MYLYFLQNRKKCLSADLWKLYFNDSLIQYKVLRSPKRPGRFVKTFLRRKKKFQVSPANVHFRSVCELIRVIKKEVNYFHYMHLLHMFEISLGQIIFFCKVTYIFVTGRKCLHNQFKLWNIFAYLHSYFLNKC